MTHLGNTLEENIPPGQERHQQKIRGAKSLLELIERQKRRKALRTQTTAGLQDDQVNVDPYQPRQVVQQKKVSAKTMVSCSSQPCFVQTELRCEKSLTEISNLGSNESHVMIESQVCGTQTFVGSPQRPRSHEICSVPSISPQQSRTESGTRFRMAACTSTSRSPRASSRSPSASTPSKTPRTPLTCSQQTPPSSRTSTTQRSPNINGAPLESPQTPRTPTACERSTGLTTPPRLCRSKSDPSPKKCDLPRKSSKQKPPSPKRSRSSDLLQVKPLVNTYHVITKVPQIRARKGAPRELQSKSIKEAFVWKNYATSHLANNNRKGFKPVNDSPVIQKGLQQQQEYESPNLSPMEKARSEASGSGLPTPHTPPVYSIPPISASNSGRQSVGPCNVHSFSTSYIDRVENLNDPLFEEYQMPCQQQQQRPATQQAKKPLVSTRVHSSPPKKTVSKGIAMYVPLTEGASLTRMTATTPKPPRVRKYNRSEVLAFMKRKRLERRRLMERRNAPLLSSPCSKIGKEKKLPIDSDRSGRTLAEFKPLSQPVKLASEVAEVARNLSNVAFTAKHVHANSPELDRFTRLLNNFDRGVTDLLSKCGFEELYLHEALEKYVAMDMPVKERLEKAMRQFEILLVKLGLRESRLVVEQISTDGSAPSLKTSAETTPSRPRPIMLQNGLQHTPRPQPTLRHSKEYLFSPTEHSPLQVPCEDIVMELNVPTKPRVSVETAVQTESVARDPNFIHEWRDKYLVAGLHSSTPKHPWSTIQEQVSFNNLDLSHISSEEQEEKSSSPHTSDTAISEIDDSAIVQARQVLRQLEVSEMNIGKAQQVLKDIQKIEDNSCVTSKGVHVQDANLEDTKRRSKNKSNINQDSSVEILRESGLRHSHGSISATSRSWSALSVIEGDDILEEAKRVLKELDVTRRSSKFKSRLNVSRNLMDSFEKAALEDSKEVNEPKRITRNVVPKNVQEDKRFAPVTLSCLVSNELDFLEDCNDTLLKMSEVSRAQCYAFAKETNLANQFLKKDQYKSPPRGDEPVEPCSAVPTVNDTLVDELRRSLQEAFDQIEQQSREMSLLKKDMSTSKGESPSKATELLRSPLPTAQFTKTPARSRTLASAALPSEDALLIESGAQEEGSMTSGSAQTASEAKSVTYTNEESSRSASSQMTISVAELKGRDDGSSADYKRLSTLPLQKLRKTSAHEKGDQDSESVSQDTRSRSSDTEKSAKSSVSVSTVKTLNSKLETQDIPVRTKSKSFSPEKGTVDGRESPSLSTLSKRTDSLTSTISTEKVIHDQQRERENENSDIEQETKDMKHQIVADKGQTAKEISPTTSTFPIGSAPLTSRTSLLYENGAGGDPLVSALVEYMERGERLWEEHRSEGFRLLKGVAVGLAAGLSASSDSTLGIASLESFLLSKMPEQPKSTERKDCRSEVQKLLNLLAKRKISQDKVGKEKIASHSTSSSGQQSSSNSSSDESGEVRQGDLKQDDAETHLKINGTKGAIETSVSAAGSKGASLNGSANNSSRSISLGTADLIENADLIRLLIKRNAEVAQKEKFVKYLERERQKIERRSEAIKKREAKLVAEMKAALERERESKISLVRDVLSATNKDTESIESSVEIKERQFRPSPRPMSVRKPRSRADSSGSEDIASMSETDASDIEGSRRALRDEQEREIRQLEKLRKVLETPEATRRPGRKEMLLKRIEVLERLLANNRAAVAMLESATHVMPKIRRPRVAVKEKVERGQESEESDVSVASRDSIASEKIRSAIENDKDEKSSHSCKDISAKAESTTPLATAAGLEKEKSNDADASEKSDSSIASVQSATLSHKSISEKSFSAPTIDLSLGDAKESSNRSEEAAKKSSEEVRTKTIETVPEDPASDTSKSETGSFSVEIQSSPSSSDSPNTKERKVDAAMDKVVQSLKDDTFKEVVKATRVDSHSARMMERLVGEAIGDIFKTNAMKPTESTGSADLVWLSEGLADELSPISSLNGTLARIGQQIFVDDASQQVCIRKIPNKPPPPYTPPKASAASDTTSHQPKAVSIAPSSSLTSEPRQPEPVVPMTLGELQTEASHAAEYLYAQLASGQTLEEASYEHSHCDGVADMAKLQYGEMLFDVAKETAEKMFRVGRNSQNLFLRPLPPKEKQQAFIDALVGAVLAAEKSKSTRPKGIWSYINSRRMDYIDFIMGKEVREEEREWTEYTRCVEQVRDQLVEQVTAHVVDTNVNAVLATL